MFSRLKNWAHRIKVDVFAIYIAGKDLRTPRLVKVIAIFIAAYALSPIDLIPDFIPVLGYLDDIIIVPLGIMLVVKMMPAELMAEYRSIAMESLKPTTHWLFAASIVCVWLIAGIWVLNRVLSSS